MGSLLSAIFSLSLVILVILLTLGLGLKIVSILRMPGANSFEHAVFATAIGLGSLGYFIFGLGLLGLLRSWVFLSLLIAVGIFTHKEILNAGQGIVIYIREKPLFARLTPEEKILAGLSAMIGGLAIIQTLTPIWDYDGLMYHMEGPRLFFQAGRIYPISNNWMTSYPFTLEMLYTLGLGLGSEQFGRLVHLTYGILLALATYLGARRFAGRETAWLSAAILIGIPANMIWSTAAYCDLGWAFYEFLAVLAVLFWIRQVKRPDQKILEGQEVQSSGRQVNSWLILAGIMMGFALGTKYMALSGAVCLGMLILWYSRRAGWKTILENCAIYGIIALLVGSPWYIKNLLWSGNPVYPLYFTQNGEVAELYAVWMNYVNGFGAPRTLAGYLSLPVLIYTQFYRFGTFQGSLDTPSLLFPLVVFYPLIRRTRNLNALGLWTILRLVAWAIGTQQTRMLLPIFPIMSILTAYVLVNITGRLPSALGRVLPRGLGFGMVTITLVYSLIYFSQIRPLGVILGNETKNGFLERQLNVYPVLQYIDMNIQPEERVWMLWDGRGYYCDERCVPDVAQSHWAQLAMNSWDAHKIADELKLRDATHLLISYEDWNFIHPFDRSGLQAKAFRFLQEEFLPACTRDLYVDKFYRLVELTCP